MRISKLILKPILTEKSTEFGLQNKYMFEVDMSANKTSIKQELKRVYGVDAVAINSSILPGKVRRQGRTNKFSKSGKRKRIIAKLKDGQKIELVSGEKKS